MKLEAVWTVLVNLGFVVGFSILMYLAMRERYAYKISKKLLSKGMPNLGMRLAKQGQGFNPANIYFTMNYDCRKVDIQISGVVPETRYWSMTVYNRYTVPLESFLVDDSLVKDQDNHYTVWVTHRSQGRSNEIDVAASPKGLLIIRNSLPKDPDEVIKTLPQVKVIQFNGYKE